VPARKTINLNRDGDLKWVIRVPYGFAIILGIAMSNANERAQMPE